MSTFVGDWGNPVPYSFYKQIIKKLMNTQETINLIKESFEVWYNKTFSKDSPVSIVINYSDVQTLAIKAFHTVTMEVQALGINNNLSYATSLIKLQENYNHGITSEEEAKLGLTKKLLIELYNYKRQL